MENESTSNCNSNKNKGGMHGNGMIGGAYFVTIVGAAIYFIQNSANFWEGVVGILKAFVWPAFVIQKVLEILKL